MEKYRKEKDETGSREIPAESMYGVSALRASEYFPLSFRRVHPAAIRSYGAVKLSYARANMELGAWSPRKFEAIESACLEMISGALDCDIIVDSLHGGTEALDSNVNEVLANFAAGVLGDKPGGYTKVSPAGDMLLRHSPLDAYFLTMKTAAVSLLRRLESELADFVDSLREHAVSPKTGDAAGKTPDAAPGRLGALTEQLSSRKWDLHSVERKQRIHPFLYSPGIELAPQSRSFILRADAHLKDITGYEMSRDENPHIKLYSRDALLEACDALEGCASAELSAASAFAAFFSASVNGAERYDAFRDISEAAAQAVICASGHLNSAMSALVTEHEWRGRLLPLISDSLLNAVDLLSNACFVLRRSCLERALPPRI